MKPEKIIYNAQTGLYEYPVMGNQTVFLRNQQGELVNNQNYDAFLVEMAKSDFRYPFEMRTENADVLREEDIELAKLYTESAKNIQKNRVEQASAKLDTLRKIYPEAPFYSDVSFLQGFVYEQTGDSIQADLRYNEFLRFSSGKFSERFRGYAFADAKDSLWRIQREYALDFLERKNPENTLGFIQSITPKYYFQSLQPGYTLNEEDLALHPGGEFFLTLGTNFSSDYSLGLQYYLSLGDVVDLNPGFFISENMQAVSIATPLQIYRSPDNSFGLKLSPSIRYNMYRSIDLNGSEREIDEKFFTGGFKVSAGYYFMQRLSVGAWYTWNYYNASRPYLVQSQQIDLWWENDYDVSLYYNIIKDFSLKAGVQNGGVAAGIYWQGTEISYNISNNSFIWRSDLY